MRKYAIFITDKDGEDHLYSLASGVYNAYSLWLEAYENTLNEVWIDEAGDDSPLYSVHIRYYYPEIEFGKRVTMASKTELMGTFGQLEAAFKLKYQNESEIGNWDILVDEIPRD